MRRKHTTALSLRAIVHADDDVRDGRVLRRLPIIGCCTGSFFRNGAPFMWMHGAQRLGRCRALWKKEHALIAELHFDPSSPLAMKVYSDYQSGRCSVFSIAWRTLNGCEDVNGVRIADAWELLEISAVEATARAANPKCRVIAHSSPIWRACSRISSA